MSLVVGIESPVCTNENLYTLEAGKLALFASSLDRGARISVVAKGEADWDAVRRLVVQALPAGETSCCSPDGAARRQT